MPVNAINSSSFNLLSSSKLVTFNRHTGEIENKNIFKQVLNRVLSIGRPEYFNAQIKRASHQAILDYINSSRDPSTSKPLSTRLRSIASTIEKQLVKRPVSLNASTINLVIKDTFAEAKNKQMIKLHNLLHKEEVLRTQVSLCAITVDKAFAIFNLSSTSKTQLANHWLQNRQITNDLSDQKQTLNEMLETQQQQEKNVSYTKSFGQLVAINIRDRYLDSRTYFRRSNAKANLYIKKALDESKKLTAKLKTLAADSTTAKTRTSAIETTAHILQKVGYNPKQPVSKLQTKELAIKALELLKDKVQDLTDAYLYSQQIS